MRNLPSIGDVVEEIDAFLERHGMSQSRFGAEATGDQNLVVALRGGSSPRLERLHRIADYMKRKDIEAGHIEPDARCDAATSSGNADEVSGQVAA